MKELAQAMAREFERATQASFKKSLQTQTEIEFHGSRVKVSTPESVLHMRNAKVFAELAQELKGLRDD